MSREILIDAIGNIDDTYVEEYANYKASAGKRWIPYEVLAACAVLVLVIGVWVWRTTKPASGPENPQQPDRIQAMRVSESARPTASEEPHPEDGMQEEEGEVPEPVESAEGQETEGIENENRDINSTTVEGNAMGSEGINNHEQPEDNEQSGYYPDKADSSAAVIMPSITEEPAQVYWNVITACNDPGEEWQDMLQPTPVPTAPPTENTDITTDGVVAPPCAVEPGHSCSSDGTCERGILIEDSVLQEIGYIGRSWTDRNMKSGKLAVLKEWHRQNGNTIYDMQVFTSYSSIEEANSKYPISAFSNVTQISKVHGTTVYLTMDSGGMTYSRFLKNSILVTLWGKMSDNEMLKIVDDMTK